MQNYKNESVYQCNDPRLLVTSCATDARQYKTYRLDKKGDSILVDRYFSYSRTPIVLRCGRCPACRKFSNDTWFLRLYHHYLSCPDSKLVFITLTFNEEQYKFCKSHLVDMPIDEWHKDDYTPIYRYFIVPFKKRLRAERGENLKFDFFCVSELGDCKDRFHFHICLFWHNHGFFGNEAKQWNISHPYSKHYVKSKRYGLRLQSDIEAFLQHKIERQWTVERYSSLAGRYVFERKGKSRRISARGSIGNVTLFIADGVGMLKYVLGYANKCQRDGYTTYHRQTPGLGKSYAKDNLSKQLYDNTLPICYAGHVNGNAMYIPTPRIYFRWFGDKQKMIDAFWQNIPLQLQRFAISQGKEHIWQVYDDDLELDRTFG